MTDLSELRRLSEALEPFSRLAIEIETLARETNTDVADWAKSCSWDDLARARDALKAVRAALAAPRAEEGWRDDPSADERWDAGLDFGMSQLCLVLGVDENTVNWEAATETLDGDVRSVIWTILRAKFGEDFDFAAAPPPSQEGSER